VLVLVSQPLLTTLSQSPKLILQLPTAQLLAAQATVPLAIAAHGLPHAPQLPTLVAVSTSQLSMGPALQVRLVPVHMVLMQLPAAQAALVAPTAVQVLPQLPQLAKSLAPLVSQPSTWLPLQSR
jgi:hypothetical protein